jgi:hypothetical protein
VCDIDQACCNGGCCHASQECCDDLTCYDPSTKKCCNDGIGTVCNISEPCCDDGTCNLCCRSLQEHPEASGVCVCAETTAHCTGPTRLWSISTCKRSVSGAQSCSITNRQVGSEYACDESTDWPGRFLCLIGQGGECTAICTAGLATCIASLPHSGGAGCEDSFFQCQECVSDLIGDPDDCGCLEVNCETGDVISTLWADAATLSGGTCP